MSASLMPHPMPAFFGTVAGVFGPMLNGYLYFYESGTTTPKDAYSDAAGTTPTGNPIRLNARGESPTAIYLGTGAYSIALHDADDVEVWTVDNIEQAGADALAAALAAAAQAQAIADSLLTTAELYTLLENNRLPVGVILPFGAATVPSGYLPCDGSAVSRTTYADLFAVIGTTYGVGNGTTTFNLPDIRAKTLRGLDQSAGIDVGRVLGSTQLPTIIGIDTGTTATPSIASYGVRSSTSTNPTGAVAQAQSDVGADPIDATDYPNAVIVGAPGSAAPSIDAGDVNGTAGAVRVLNLAVPFIIKAYDAPLTGANPPPAVQTESTTARTLSLADRNTYIRCTNGSAVTITVPPESSVGFSRDDEIHVMQAGDGTVTAAAAVGVTIGPGTAMSTAAKGKAFTLKKVDTNTWDIFGGLA